MPRRWAPRRTRRSRRGRTAPRSPAPAGWRGGRTPVARRAPSGRRGCREAIVAPAAGVCPRTAGGSTYADLRSRPALSRARRRSRAPVRRHYHRHMKRRAVPFRLPVLAQDVLLGLLVAAMQVQGTLAKPQDVGSRPLTDLGGLGYVLLAVSGLVLVVRRRWPVPVFAAAGVASLVYYGVGFSDGPGWI